MRRFYYWIRTVTWGGVACVVLLAGACTVRQAPVPEPDPVWLNQIAEADRFSLRNHYLGWERAEHYYAKAMEIREDTELRRRRRMNLGLLILRKAALEAPVTDTALKYLPLRSDLNRPIELCLDWLVRRVSIHVSPKTYEVETELAQNSEKIETAFMDLLAEPTIQVETFDDDREIFVYLEYIQHRLKSLEEIGDKKAALFTVMEAHYPDSPFFLFLRHPRRQSNTIYMERDDDYLEPRLFEAQERLSQGRRAAAEALFNQVLSRSTDISGVYRGLGLIHLGWENYARAMDHFTQAIARMKGDHESYFGLGAAQLYAQQYEDSLATFSKVVEMNLRYGGEARYYKALNLYNLKRTDEALTQLEEAQTFLPDLSDIPELQGIIHYHDGALELARSRLEKCIALAAQKKSSGATAQFYLGLIEYKAGRYREAFTLFDRCILADLTAIGMNLVDLRRLSGRENPEDPREIVLKKTQLQRSIEAGRGRYVTVVPLLKKCPVKALRRQIEGWIRQIEEIAAENPDETKSIMVH